MALLVRTWNLFHGNTVPPGREDRLQEMVALAGEGADVACLQELPVWALPHLDEWSGLVAVGAVAAPPRLGPFPSTAELGRRLTVHHGAQRSTFTGQANAVLVRPPLRVADANELALNPRSVRRREARRLDLPLLARLAWAKERRVCQAVRLALPEGGTAVVANLHATSYPPDARLADAEVLRAATFADGVARPEEPVVLAGDLNVRAARSETLAALREPDWGFAGGGHGVDHVLVRGLPVSSVAAWPEERRRRDGLLLSDHAPVEARVG